ncbi:MAG: hypothetical protein MJ252_23655 [archaeon]|nr:hypothetical protein [archaeon]
MMAKQAQLTIEDLKINHWSIDAGDFINKLLQRKPENRIGFRGVDEIREHSWFYDFPWDDLYRKEYKSPFIPDSKDNYDKRYCEAPDKIDLETQERYEKYQQSSKYKNAFYNFTYVKIGDEEEENPSENEGNEDNNTNDKNSNTNSSNTEENDQQPSYIVLYKNKDAPVFMNNNKKGNEEPLNIPKEKTTKEKNNQRSLIREDIYKTNSNSTKNTLSFKKTFKIKRNINLNINSGNGNICATSSNNIFRGAETSTNRLGLKINHSVNTAKNLGLTITYSSTNVNSHSKNKKILKDYDAQNSKKNVNSLNKESQKKALFTSLLKQGISGLPNKNKKTVPIKSISIENKSKNFLNLTIKSPNNQSRKNISKGTDKTYSVPLKTCNPKSKKNGNSLIRVNSLCLDRRCFSKKREKSMSKGNISYTNLKNIYEKVDGIPRCKSNYHMKIGTSFRHRNCKSPVGKIYHNQLQMDSQSDNNYPNISNNSNNEYIPNYQRSSKNINENALVNRTNDNEYNNSKEPSLGHVSSISQNNIIKGTKHFNFIFNGLEGKGNLPFNIRQSCNTLKSQNFSIQNGYNTNSTNNSKKNNSSHSTVSTSSVHGIQK